MTSLFQLYLKLKVYFFFPMSFHSLTLFAEILTFKWIIKSPHILHLGIIVISRCCSRQISLITFSNPTFIPISYGKGESHLITFKLLIRYGLGSSWFPHSRFSPVFKGLSKSLLFWKRLPSYLLKKTYEIM